MGGFLDQERKVCDVILQARKTQQHKGCGRVNEACCHFIHCEVNTCRKQLFAEKERGPIWPDKRGQRDDTVERVKK